MIRHCATCGDAFEVAPEQADWRHRCLSCWRASKKAQETRRDPGGYWAPAPTEARLKRHLAAALGKVEQLEAELERRAEVELDPSMLKLLIQLTHPDKHSNSPGSIKATKYLNALRRLANE